MPATQQEKGARNTLNLRIKAELREMIDRAAEISGKNRTDFVLSAARQAAENTLLDRTVIAVDSKTYAEFVARLDAPPSPNETAAALPWNKRAMGEVSALSAPAPLADQSRVEGVLFGRARLTSG